MAVTRPLHTIPMRPIQFRWSPFLDGYVTSTGPLHRQSFKSGPNRPLSHVLYQVWRSVTRRLHIRYTQFRGAHLATLELFSLQVYDQHKPVVYLAVSESSQHTSVSSSASGVAVTHLSVTHPLHPITLSPTQRFWSPFLDVYVSSTGQLPIWICGQHRSVA